MYHFFFVSFYFDPMRNNKLKQQSSLKNLFLFLPRDFFKERKRKKERKKCTAGLDDWLFRSMLGATVGHGAGHYYHDREKEEPSGGSHSSPRSIPFERSKQKKILT